jgi:hypothetical protein
MNFFFFNYFFLGKFKYDKSIGSKEGAFTAGYYDRYDKMATQSDKVNSKNKKLKLYKKIY